MNHDNKNKSVLIAASLALCALGSSPADAVEEMVEPCAPGALAMDAQARVTVCSQPAGDPAAKQTYLLFLKERDGDQLPSATSLLAFGADRKARRLANDAAIQRRAASSAALLRQYLATRAIDPARISAQFPATDAFAIALTASEVPAVARWPQLRALTTNFEVGLIAPLDAAPAALTSAVQPNIEQIQAPLAWSHFSTQGEGAVVGGIDTGVYAHHEALAANYACPVSGPQADCWLDPYDKTTVSADPKGHGTHTMGLAVGSHGIGVAPGAKWIACKGLRDGGNGQIDKLVSCMEWMLRPNGKPENAPDAVINSWGTYDLGFDYQKLFGPTLQAWHNANIFPAFAVGNRLSCGTAAVPASLPQTVAVGSVNARNRRSSFSARGSSPTNPQLIKPDLMAPGGGDTSTEYILSASIAGTNQYEAMRGTSMAAPHVAGLAALLASMKPGLSVDESVRAMRLSALPIPASDEGACNRSGVPNDDTGWGMIQALGAAQAALGGIERRYAVPMVYGPPQGGAGSTAATIPLTTALHFQNLSLNAAATVTIILTGEGQASPGWSAQYPVNAGGSGSLDLRTLPLPAGFRGSALIIANQPLAVTAIQSAPAGSPMRAQPASSAIDQVHALASLNIPTILNGSTVTRFAVQNLDTGPVDLHLLIYATTGGSLPVASIFSRNLPGLSTRFFDAAQLNLVQGFTGSAHVDAMPFTGSHPALAASALELGTQSLAGAAFEGTSGGHADTALPSALCNYHGTSSYYAVQNLSSQPTSVSLVYEGGATQSAEVQGLSKVSFATCNAAGIAPGYIGSATLYSVGRVPLAVVAKIVGGGANGVTLPGPIGPVIGVPYVRWSESRFATGERQRVHIAVQNVGIPLAPGELTIQFRDAHGNVIGTHRNAEGIGTGVKLSTWAMHPNVEGDRNALSEFGYANAGGSVLISGPPGSELSVTARVSTGYGSGTLVSEDYTGTPWED